MNFVVLLSVYAGLRTLSLFTYNYPALNGFLAAGLVLGFAYLCFRNIKLGWIFLVFELFLDGAGHFFSWQNLLLRTWWLGIFGTLWLWTTIKSKKIIWPNKKIFWSLCSIASLVIFATLNGLGHNHVMTAVLQDMILFVFLVLLFPALQWSTVTTKIWPIISKVWLIGTAVFSFLTFAIYTSGLGTLPDWYYHWFRNIAAGKITDLGQNFFRVVLPEHLFIVPIILIIASYLLINSKNKKLWGLMILSAGILALNFSRIYFLGLGAGLLVLLYKESWKDWLKVSTLTGLVILGTFSSLYLLASRGQSIGLELIGLKVGQATVPQSDVSGAIRLAILPDALEQIKTYPWFGTGLGATVTYQDPATHQTVTRTQFDWGYLEMLAELGIVGTIIFLHFIALIIWQTKKVAFGPLSKHAVLSRGLLAGLVALLVINITTPAIFHGLGILYLVLIIVVNHASLQSPALPHDTSEPLT